VRLNKKNHSRLSVGIPIYKPDNSFFLLLNDLVSKFPIIDHYIIFETIDSISQSSHEPDIKQIISHSGSKLSYEKVLKEKFDHSRTRNQIVERSSSDYILFITQDILIGHIDLEGMISSLDLTNSDACTVRHEPLKYAFSKSWELMFSHIAFNFMSHNQISWWSNNFSIYRVDKLRDLPFPDFPFAEDYYWTRLANGMGLKLQYFMKFSIYHHNQDSIDAAKKRGILEAKAAFAASNFFGEAINPIPVYRSMLRLAFGLLRYEFELRHLLNFVKELHLYISYLVHNFFRIKTWNNLIKRGAE